MTLSKARQSELRRLAIELLPLAKEESPLIEDAITLCDFVSRNHDQELTIEEATFVEKFIDEELQKLITITD